jgi:hypothetical protein
MKTGIELIAQERHEQINKHGRSVQSDVDNNSNDELKYGIMLLITNLGYMQHGMEMPKEAFEDLKPDGWGFEICWKMINKPEIDQLKIIGAFAAAEIDRLQNKP